MNEIANVVEQGSIEEFHTVPTLSLANAYASLAASLTPKAIMSVICIILSKS